MFPGSLRWQDGRDSTGFSACGNSERRTRVEQVMTGSTNSDTSEKNGPRFPMEFGRYTLLESVAVGGMGEVFLGRVDGAAGFEKTVVIKQILPHLASDPEFVQRFIAEGRLLVQLNHPNIAAVSDLGVHEGQYYLVIEHVDGCDVRHVVRDARARSRALPHRLVVSMLASVAEGLTHAHGATVETGGIVHRDISPANIMISRAGHVKLIDFGIARVGTGATNSISGVVRGKFPYMSPEQASGDPLDGRGDVFSLGVVAYELFSGQRPFDAPSDLKVLDRIRFDEPTPLSEVVPTIDSDLADLVTQCLSKERDDRPTSREMAARLALWLHAQPDPVGAGELGELVLESLTSESHEKWSLDEALQGGLDSNSGGSQGTATWSLSSSLSSEEGEKAPVSLERTPVGLDEATGELLRSLLEVRPVRAMKHLKWAIGGLSVLVFALMAWNLWMLEDQKEYRTLVGESLSPAPSPERASLERSAPTEIRRLASPSMVQNRRSLELQQSHRTVSVVSHPPGARIRLGSGPGLLAPVHRALKPGERVEGRATLRGHRSRPFVLTAESPDIVHIRLAAVGKGTVRFRFLPANASVMLNGKILETAGRNVVARELAEGEHALEIRPAGGGAGTIRKFTIRASETTTLGTIEP